MAAQPRRHRATGRSPAVGTADTEGTERRAIRMARRCAPTPRQTRPRSPVAQLRSRHCRASRPQQQDSWTGLPGRCRAAQRGRCTGRAAAGISRGTPTWAICVQDRIALVPALTTPFVRQTLPWMAARMPGGPSARRESDGCGIRAAAPPAVRAADLALARRRCWRSRGCGAGQQPRQAPVELRCRDGGGLRDLRAASRRAGYA